MANDLIPAMYELEKMEPRYSREADDLILKLRSGSHVKTDGHRSVLMMIEPPSPSERGRLIARARDLAHAFDHHNKMMKAALISDMLGSYEPHAVANPEAITKYVMELHDIPTWAVMRACQKIKGGQAADIVSRIHKPNTIQLRVLCESICEERRIEQRLIGMILNGKKIEEPQDEGMRQRVGELMIDFANGLRASVAENERKEVEAMMARRQRDGTDPRSANEISILREYDRLGADPIYSGGGLLISPSLAKKMGRLRPMRRRAKRAA